MTLLCVAQAKTVGGDALWIHSERRAVRHQYVAAAPTSALPAAGWRLRVVLTPRSLLCVLFVARQSLFLRSCFRRSTSSVGTTATSAIPVRSSARFCFSTFSAHSFWCCALSIPMVHRACPALSARRALGCPLTRCFVRLNRVLLCGKRVAAAVDVGQYDVHHSERHRRVARAALRECVAAQHHHSGQRGCGWEGHHQLGAHRAVYRDHRRVRNRQYWGTALHRTARQMPRSDLTLVLFGVCDGSAPSGRASIGIGPRQCF